MASYLLFLPPPSTCASLLSLTGSFNLPSWPESLMQRWCQARDQAGRVLLGSPEGKQALEGEVSESKARSGLPDPSLRLLPQPTHWGLVPLMNPWKYSVEVPAGQSTSFGHSHTLPGHFLAAWPVGSKSLICCYFNFIMGRMMPTSLS